MIRLSVLSLSLLLLAPQCCQAELKLSPVFGDSMVVQRDKPIHVWGWTSADTDVRVELAGHEGTAKSDSSGRFDVMLDPLPAGGPHTMTIDADETKTFSDVSGRRSLDLLRSIEHGLARGQCQRPGSRIAIGQLSEHSLDLGASGCLARAPQRLQRQVGSLLHRKRSSSFRPWATSLVVSFTKHSTCRLD